MRKVFHAFSWDQPGTDNFGLFARSFLSVILDNLKPIGLRFYLNDESFRIHLIAAILEVREGLFKPSFDEAEGH